MEDSEVVVLDAEFRQSSPMPGDTSKNLFVTMLQTPGIIGVSSEALMARFSQSMCALVMSLILQRFTEDFSLAGTAGALVSIVSSLGTWVQGKLMDRKGSGLVLGCFAVIFLLAAFGTGIAAVRHRPIEIFIASALFGFFMPNWQTTTRMVWCTALPAGQVRDFAMRLDAVLFDLVYAISPIVAGFLVASAQPLSGLAVAAGGLGIGSLALSRHRLVRAIPTIQELVSEKTAFTMRSFPLGLWILCYCNAALLCSCAMIEFAVTGVARIEGMVSWTGVLLGLWSVSSVVGAFVLPKAKINKFKYFLVALGSLSVLNFLTGVAGLIPQGTGRVVVFGVLLFIAGIPFAYTAAQTNTLAADLFIHVPATAFSLILMGASIGFGIGLYLSGYCVQNYGPYVTCCIAGLVGLSAVLCGFMARKAVTHQMQLIQESM